MFGCKTIRLICMLAGAVLFFCQAYAAEFSADLFLANPGDSATARIYVRGDVYRVEKLNGDQKFLAIENRLTDITTAMNPEELTYMNLEGPSGAFSNPIKGWEYMAKNTAEKYLGVDTVNGYECDHYSYAYEGASEARMESWKSKKLDHFIRYVVHYGGSGDGLLEIRNVVEGPLADALFQVPDGYTREKTAEEIELERPAISAKEASAAPVGRRIVSGGELSVRVNPELSTRVELTNLIKDTSVCYVHLYKGGQRIDLANLPEPEDETFVLTYNGDRKQPMYGMQHQADEVRIKLDRGRVMATVFNEYSSFDDVKQTQYFVSGSGRGMAGLDGRPIHLKIVGDSPAGEMSHVKLHVYERTYVDGVGQERTIEKLEFDLKNGEEKVLDYSVETGANAASIGTDEGGGVKVFFVQPEQYTFWHNIIMPQIPEIGFKFC